MADVRDRLQMVVAASDLGALLRVSPTGGLITRQGWPFAALPALDVLEVDSCVCVNSVTAVHALNFARADPAHLHTVLLLGPRPPPGAFSAGSPATPLVCDGALWRLRGEATPIGAASPVRACAPWRRSRPEAAAEPPVNAVGCRADALCGDGDSGEDAHARGVRTLAASGGWAPARFVLDAGPRRELRRHPPSRAVGGGACWWRRRWGGGDDGGARSLPATPCSEPRAARWTLPLERLLSVDIVRVRVTSAAPPSCGTTATTATTSPTVAAVRLGLAGGGGWRHLVAPTLRDAWRWAAALLTAAQHNVTPAAAAQALLHEALAAHAPPPPTPVGDGDAADTAEPAPAALFPAPGVAAACVAAMLRRERAAQLSECALLAAEDAAADAVERAALARRAAAERARGRLDLDLAARVWAAPRGACGSGATAEPGCCS